MTQPPWTQPPEDRVLTGSEPYPVTSPGNPLYQVESPTFEANESWVPAGLNTTRSFSSLPRSIPVSPLRGYGRQLSGTGSLLGQAPQSVMSGRTLHGSASPLNLGPALSNAIHQPTGTSLNNRPLRENSIQSPLIYLYDIIVPSRRSARIIASQLLWNDDVYASGAQLVLVSREPLGNLEGKTHMLKIREANSGVDTAINALLSLMNLEEESTYPTFYDGRTAIRSQWRLKDLQDLSVPSSLYSRAISHPENGIQR